MCFSVLNKATTKSPHSFKNCLSNLGLALNIKVEDAHLRQIDDEFPCRLD